MARDGSGVYHRPVGTDAVTDTTIESTKYNVNVADVEQDLNLPRPIVAGGTGASNAAQALVNLGAEITGVNVANYDSQLWQSGSFYSAAGALGAPVAGHAFVGIAYCSDPPAIPPTNNNVVLEARDQNDTAVPGQMYIREKKAGVWGAWTSAAVIRYDVAQTLTAAQQTQARQNIYAAPFDAMSYNGLQINGGMLISQEVGTTGVTATGKYFADGWMLFKAGTMAINAAQYAGAPPGLGYNAAIIVNTAQTVLGVLDFVFDTQRIEGYRIQRLMWGSTSAQPITLGFWSCHHRTGAYSGSIRNGITADRSYVFTYTQNAADTWEYKTITIPGCIDGTWNVINAAGIDLSFVMAAGTSYATASTGTWLTGNFVSSTSQVNAVASTADVFRLAGVFVLPGGEAPNAARSPFILRPYEQELYICERYFQSPQSAANYAYVGYLAATNIARVGVPFRTTMRAGPTLLLPNPALCGINCATINTTAISATALASAIGAVGVDLTVAGTPFVVGQGCVVGFPNSSIFFDARL